MTETSSVKFTFTFNDPDFDAEEKDEEVQKLLNQMRDIDELEETGRVLDPNPPEGNKAFGGFLVGMLTASVNSTNTKKVLGFFSDRLSGKAIEMNVEANGKKLSVKANSRAELEAAIEAAQKFLEG